MTHSEVLMTYQELAAYVRFTERHLRRLVARNGIPYVRLQGWSIRFKRSEIDAWLQRESRRPRRIRRRKENASACTNA
jgi:excisionase family DNA binding protein